MECPRLRKRFFLLAELPLLIAVISQTVLAQENGYWDDRFTAKPSVEWDKENNSFIQAIAVTDNGEIYASGYQLLDRIIKWDGKNWSSFGSSDGSVYAFITTKNEIYVGGRFTTIGGIPANRVAKYDANTKSWSALETDGFNGISPRELPADGYSHRVYTLAVDANNLYVGGSFTAAGAVNAKNIARWNMATKTWSALGTGINGTVSAIVIKDGEVYVGGSFFSAGDVPANNIAKWNGQEWSALGSGVDRGVTALTICGDDLYVGGGFNKAGEADARGIAKWNTLSKTWSDVGGGVAGGVYALASNGRFVYVGGTIGAVGEYEAGNYIETGKIAQWNPAKSCWSSLSKGLGSPIGVSSAYSPVHSILVRKNEVYVGGKFSSAGGKPSQLFGIWHETKGRHAPAWSPIPDVTFPENGSTQSELYPFVTDTEHSLHGLDFKAKVIRFQKHVAEVNSLPNPPQNELDKLRRLQIRLEKLIIGRSSRYVFANFKADHDASGVYTVVFTVTDPCGASDSDTIKVTVTASNDPPVLAALPELRLNEDRILFHPIRDWHPFVTDDDDPDSTLKFTVLSGKHVRATRHPRRFAFVAPANWFGRDTLQVIVTDRSHLADTTALMITVDPTNDKPRWTGLPDSLVFNTGASTQLKMWDSVEDVETPDSLLLYRFAASKAGLRWNFHRATGTLVLTAPQFHGNAQLFVKAGDGKAAAYDTIVVRVEMPEDILAKNSEQNSAEQIPTEFVLQQNYPNPFNPTTLIRFGLPHEVEVKLEVLNLAGQHVVTLLNERKAAGYHEVIFNAAHLPSGNYFTVLKAGETKLVRRIVLMK